MLQDCTNVQCAEMHSHSESKEQQRGTRRQNLLWPLKCEHLKSWLTLWSLTLALLPRNWMSFDTVDLFS